MQPITELPDPQREVLRQLFFAPDHTLTPMGIAEKVYYPNDVVMTAIFALEKAGLIRQASIEGDTLQLRPIEEILEQMRALNQQADKTLKEAFNKAKEQTGDE